MPLHLTAEHRDAVLYAAQALTADRRRAFVDDVTTTLQTLPEIGPGNLHRVIVDAQRAHFDPPQGLSLTNSAPRSRAY